MNHVQATPKPLAILLCAGPDYFQHVAVALASVAAANRGHAIDAHLIANDHDARAEARLRATVARLPNLGLTLHRHEDGANAGWHVDRHLSKECYLRLVAADVLPASLDRVLYLDSDLVVLDDLMPLWMTDLGGHPVAAVPDILTQPPRAALGIAPDHVYVNSGVLLIDLAAWRARGLTARIAGFVERQGSALEYHDQDALNAVLQHDIRLLDFRWNLQARHMRFNDHALGVHRDAFRRAAAAPAILHYAGPEKPWRFRARTARKADYDRHLAMTDWRGARPTLAHPGQRLEYRLDRALARLGVDYRQIPYLVGRCYEESAARLGRAPRSLSR